MLTKHPTLTACALALVFTAPSLPAKTIKSTEELEYGTVLYDYYQKKYFSALVQQEYSFAAGNFIAASGDAQVLKGGMMLSYGMADSSEIIFDELLSGEAEEATRNKAWYYLAKLYYQKGEPARASQQLLNIVGDVPEDIHSEYHYLASLINIQGKHLGQAESIIGEVLKDSSYEPYLLYNLAIGKIQSGKPQAAGEDLLRVTG